MGRKESNQTNKQNNIFLKTLLQQGISEPVFYGDLVYKVGKSNFSDQFKNISNVMKEWDTTWIPCDYGR